MGRKKRRGALVVEGARRASETTSAGGAERRGRFSTRRKTEAVVRLLRGESLESISRELGVTAARLSEWREEFLAGGQVALKSRAEDDDRDEEIRRLKTKIGDMAMENELLYEKIHRMEANLPLASRRSRR